MKKLPFYVVVFSFFLMTFVAGTQYMQANFWEAKHLELRSMADSVDQECDVTGCRGQVRNYNIETMEESCQIH